MALRDLIAWGREQPSVPSRRGEELSPFLTLHREMDRLFDDVFNRFDSGVPSLFRQMPSWPSIEMIPSENQIRVSAELPGLEEKDVELLVDEDVLTIRGEKAETEDKERRFSERFYGRFERVIPLPFAVEEGKAEASFQNGVLTVTLPKSAKAQDRAKRIAIGGGKDTQH